MNSELTPSEPSNENLIKVPEGLMPASEAETVTEEPSKEVIEVPEFIRKGMDASELHQGPSYTTESVKSIAQSELLRRQAEMAAMSKVAIKAAQDTSESHDS